MASDDCYARIVRDHEYCDEVFYTLLDELYSMNMKHAHPGTTITRAEIQQTDINQRIWVVVAFSVVAREWKPGLVCLEGVAPPKWMDEHVRKFFRGALPYGTDAASALAHVVAHYAPER